MTALEINFTPVNGRYQSKQLNIVLVLHLGFNFNLRKWTEFHHHLRERERSWVLSRSCPRTRDWIKPNESEPG